MRHLLSLLMILFVLSTSLIAQEDNKDEKLLAKFTEKELAQMRIDEPEMIAYWRYYADQRCMQAPVRVGEQSMEVPEVEFDLDEANYLLLDLEPYMERGGILRVKGTDIRLIVKPEKLFRKELGWE